MYFIVVFSLLILGYLVLCGIGCVISCTVMAFCNGFSSGSSDLTIESSGYHQPDTYQEPVKAPHVDRHAEWVKKDAERHHRIEQEYEQGWAEDYMDEHDW